MTAITKGTVSERMASVLAHARLRILIVGAGRIEVEHDPVLSDVAALVNSVAKVGYAARPAAF